MEVLSQPPYESHEASPHWKIFTSFIVHLVPAPVESAVEFIFWSQVSGPSSSFVPCLLRASIMAFSRSVTSFLRTSRHIVSPTRGANPVNRVFGHDRFGARTYAAVFQRDKPHVNVGECASIPPYCIQLTTFRYHWSCRPWQGKNPIRRKSKPQAYHARPRLQQPSPKDKPRKDLHSS